jgi:hypothetical protein
VIAYSVNMIQRHRTYHEVIHELDRNKPVKKGSNVKKTPKEKQKNLKLLKITNKMVFFGYRFNAQYSEI